MSSIDPVNSLAANTQVNESKKRPSDLEQRTNQIGQESLQKKNFFTRCIESIKATLLTGLEFLYDILKNIVRLANKYLCCCCCTKVEPHLLA